MLEKQAQLADDLFQSKSQPAQEDSFLRCFSHYTWVDLMGAGQWIRAHSACPNIMLKWSPADGVRSPGKGRSERLA